MHTGHGCLKPDYKAPALSRQYSGVTFELCKNLCSKLHAIDCSMVAYMPTVRIHHNCRPQTKFAKVMFLQMSVCPHLGGMHGFIWGACVVLFGGVCMVLFGGACVVLFGGHAWFYLGGHAWFYFGGHTWFYLGGVHGFIQGGMRCFIWGGMHSFIQGGRAWFFQFFRIQ